MGETGDDVAADVEEGRERIDEPHLRAAVHLLVDDGNPLCVGLPTQHQTESLREVAQSVVVVGDDQVGNVGQHPHAFTEICESVVVEAE